MSDATQYPDGYYMVTWPNTDTQPVRVENGVAIGELVYGPVASLVADGCTLTPLVPAPTEPTLNEMIMQLRALLHPGIDNNWMCSYAKPGEYYSQSYYGATPEAAVRACWEAVCKHE